MYNPQYFNSLSKNICCERKIGGGISFSLRKGDIFGKEKIQILCEKIGGVFNQYILASLGGICREELGITRHHSVFETVFFCLDKRGK